jgi:ABC-type transport system substrate-binding protein
VDAVDGVVVLKLRRRAPELVEALSTVETSVTAKGRGPTFKKAIGSGPFRLLGFDRKQRKLVLAAYDGHFAGRPYLDSVVLRWFNDANKEARDYEVGKSHLSFRGAVAFAGQGPKYKTNDLESKSMFLVYLGFGSGHAGALSSRSVRRAFSMAIDYKAVAAIGSGEKVGNGGQLMPPSWSPGVSSVAAGSRLAEAKQLWRTIDARAVQRLTATPLEIIVDQSRPDDREIAEKVLAALYQLGLKGRIQLLPSDLFAGRVAAGRCDLYVGQLVSPYPSAPWLSAAALARSGGKAVSKALAAQAPSRAPLRRRIREQRPLVPLFHRAVRVHFRSNLYGVRFDRGASISFADLHFHGRPVRSPRNLGGTR